MAYKDKATRDAHNKAWRAANPEKAKEIDRRYRETHRAEMSRRSGEWNKKHRPLVTARAYAAHFKKKFGITLEDKARLLSEQDGRCATCGAGELDKVGPWCLDHDHETGKIRGVLCRRCNMTLGSLGDNPAILRNMIAYLKGEED